jgi:leader peptidase (prepilin peptidase)/N-methyltransferase
MEILLTVVFTLLGVAVGSFLNVCIDRLPVGGSLVSPPSRCDTCQHKLSPEDLIPVFSYLWLRGRCRYCQARIPRRVLLVELLSGIFFFLASLRFVLIPDSPEYAPFAITAIYGCVFLVIMFIDWEHKLILNKVTYPAAVVVLIILGVDSFWSELGLLNNLHFLPELSILSGIIGGAIGFAFFLIVLLINPRGMGMGDIKLAGLIGLVTGFPLVILALFIGIFIGGLVAVVLLLLRVKGRKDAIPYGTFLALGPLITLLWGHDILTWYLEIF